MSAPQPLGLVGQVQRAQSVFILQPKSNPISHLIEKFSPKSKRQSQPARPLCFIGLDHVFARSAGRPAGPESGANSPGRQQVARPNSLYGRQIRHWPAKSWPLCMREQERRTTTTTTTAGLTSEPRLGWAIFRGVWKEGRISRPFGVQTLRSHSTVWRKFFPSFG